MMRKQTNIDDKGGHKMKLSSEIKAEIAATEWARNLAKMGGYNELARARTTKNRAQIEVYKNSTKGK